MDKIIPNGEEVLIFYDFKGQSRGANEREFVKGVVVNSRESNDLSYHGSAWYEQIYNVIDENGRNYEATYGNAYVGSFFIRTIEHHMSVIKSKIADNNEEICALNKENGELNATLEELARMKKEKEGPVMGLKMNNKKNKKKNIMKMQRAQRKYIAFGTCLLLCLWVVSFFAKISLSSINVEVEKLGKEVTKQEKTNQSLSMKINELASLENIQAVANNEGLAYNNGNIVIINNQ